MFWRDRERDNSNSKDQNGGPLCGQVRVLVVGDSGIHFLFRCITFNDQFFIYMTFIT